MFNAKFISCNSGVSAKTGKEWYQVELIAETVEGGNKVLQAFCTVNAYNNCVGVPSMSDIKVACGVTPGGYITVNAIKVV